MLKLLLTMHVPCIVTNYVNKPTRWTFCTYLFYNLCKNLHVSNDHFVQHQEFVIYCICSSVQTIQTCLTAVVLRLDPNRKAMMNEMVVRNM